MPLLLPIPFMRPSPLPFPLPFMRFSSSLTRCLNSRTLRLSWFFLWFKVMLSASTTAPLGFSVNVNPPRSKACMSSSLGSVRRALTAVCILGSPLRPSFDGLVFVCLFFFWGNCCCCCCCWFPSFILFVLVMDAELAINSIWVLSVQKLTFVFLYVS